MSYELHIRLIGLPPMNTADGANRWARKNDRDCWYRAVSVACTGRLPSSPLGKARVRITRRSASAREPDFENLTQGGKHLLDGLVRCGVLLDDNPDVIGRTDYVWEKAPPKGGNVTIDVWEGVRSPLSAGQSELDFGS